MMQQTAYLKPNTGATRILYSPPTEQLVSFARRFIQNVDWVFDLLSLTNKLLLQQDAEITRFERLIIQDYLNFRLLQTAEGLKLVDRSGHAFDAPSLLNLREQLLYEAEQRALFLYYNPQRHPMAKAFKQVLTKIGDKPLSEEEAAILREAYLYEHQGQIYTLRGKKLERHSRSQRWIWKLMHG